MLLAMKGPTRIPMIDAISDEHRSVQRRKVLKSGVIMINRTSTYNCTVRNMSSRGAKLDVPTVVGIPDVFELKVDGATQHCRVIWRRLKELGVSFLPAPSSSGPQDRFRAP